VKKDIDFKKDIRLKLRAENAGAFRIITLDWYPKVQILHQSEGSAQSKIEENHLQNVSPYHTAFINWDRVYFDLEKFKKERKWYNLVIEKPSLQTIIAQSWWYELYIPDYETEIDSFSKVQLWGEVVTALLKAYIDRFYNRYKSEYLSKHMKTEWLTPEHPNFEQEYEVQIEASEKRIIENVTRLADVMKKGAFDETEHGNIDNGFKAFNFLRHLYKPLLYLNQKTYKDIVKISPIALVESEWNFVKDLKAYYLNNGDRFKNTKLCLLRNQSRKGVGFFESQGFYPDFILWLIEDGKQHIAFIDPKGLRQVTGFDHQKIRFYRTIKEEIEARIDDEDIDLNSFIVSDTSYSEVQHWQGGHSIQDFNKHHVYFMQNQRSSYIEAILSKMRIFGN
jgi:hypothetical protein